MELTLTKVPPPDISPEDFASATGYHAYNTRVGLGAFDDLVCLITQFFVELRETHPAGFLVWVGVVVVNLPWYGFSLEASGQKGARGPLLYPAIMALLFQIFGVSVMFPMVWIPSFVFGEGQRGAPLTSYRTAAATWLALPMTILTILVFAAPTDSQLWTTSAGILGGPWLAMCPWAVFLDGSSKLVATKENVRATSEAMKKIYKFLSVIGLVGWYILVAIAYRAYGTSPSAFWNDVWVTAGPSVKFMAIDTGVLYLAMLLFLGYRCGEAQATRALLLTTVLGPAAACCVVLIEDQDAAKSFALSASNNVKKVG